MTIQYLKDYMALVYKDDSRIASLNLFLETLLPKNLPFYDIRDHIVAFCLNIFNSITDPTIVEYIVL